MTLSFRFQSLLVAATASLSIAMGGQAAAQSLKSDFVFPPGSTMDTIQKRGKLIVGSRINQPGVAQLNPITGQVEGFDADIARALAARLGLSADKVEFLEVMSSNREPALQQGLVDIVVTAYVITPKRRELVGQAGPYITAHTRLFVHKDNLDLYKSTDDIAGKKICSAPTGTPVPIIKKFGGILVPFDDNTACTQQVVNKTLDGKMSNDLNTIGSFQQFPELVFANLPNLSDEVWGVGLKKDEAAF